MRFDTVWAIANKDIRQFVRDRTMLLFLILLPLLQLALLVQATGRGIQDIPIAVLDLERSAASRALVALFDASDTLAVVDYPNALDESLDDLEYGRIYAVFIIPAGMTAVVQNPTDTLAVQAIIDGSNVIIARVIEGAGQQVIQRFLQQQGGMGRGGISIEAQMRYNIHVSSRPYSIGAQLGFITYQITLGVAALGLAREREMGTMEQLMVTPVRRPELLLGKVIPPTLVGLFDFFLLTLLVVFVFGIPVRGSYPFLLAASVLFIAVEVVWGTLISSLAANQQQAILLVFIQAMVDVALCGYLVPVRDMPALMGWVAQFVPLNHFLIIVRSVVLKGSGPEHLWPHLLAIAGIGVVMALIATRTLASKLD